MNRIKGEVRKEQIRIADTLSIVTTNTTYKFFVIDPQRFYGMLVGGVVGPVAIEAYVDTLSLRVGSRAHVICALANGYRYLTTSTVQVVIHFKAETADEIEESLPDSERVTAKLPAAKVRDALAAEAGLFY